MLSSKISLWVLEKSLHRLVRPLSLLLDLLLRFFDELFRSLIISGNFFEEFSAILCTLKLILHSASLMKLRSNGQKKLFSAYMSFDKHFLQIVCPQGSSIGFLFSSYMFVQLLHIIVSIETLKITIKISLYLTDTTKI